MRFLICIPLFAGICAAQQPPIIHVTQKEVLLDLVVRDKKGHLVRDLQPSDVEVYEDGVKQKVTSFRGVEGREQLQTEKSAAAVTPASQTSTPGVKALPEITFVSIVLAPMSPHNYDFARQAVLTFLKSGDLPNTYVTIYRLDTQLRLIQPFTQDVAALTHATNEATRILSAHAQNPATSVFSTQAATATLSSAAATGGPGATNPPGAQPSLQTTDPTFQRFAATLDASTAGYAALQAEAVLDTRLRFVDSYVTGMTTIDSLRELVHSQARLQGRKIVLYLSDGLTLPIDRPEVFDKLVSDANRSGVTFYTVDTRGLSITSPITSSVAQANQAVADNALRNAPTGAENIGAHFDAMSQPDDVARTAVTNTQQALQELAERTGGSATANTNEIAGPMERVMESIRTHYELSYTPSSDVYDGHFRKIEVKVDRPKVTVETRRGYYALPELNGQPLQSFEVAALNSINTRPLPRTFPYEADLLEFRPEQNAVQCELAFEVPISSLSFQANPKTGRSRLQASVFALVQDAKGEVVYKVGRELYREIPTNQISAVKDEKIEYGELIELAPGPYTINTVVRDEKMQRTTVKRFAAYVQPEAQLGLSSIGLVKRVDALAGPRDPANPLEMSTQRVTLTLADTVPSGKPVPLYFVVYPAAADQGELKLTVELFRDGKEVARSSPDLPKPDSTGSIAMVAQLSPAPGSYAVRVTAQQGASIAQTTRALTVE